MAFTAQHMRTFAKNVAPLIVRLQHVRDRLACLGNDRQPRNHVALRAQTLVDLHATMEALADMANALEDDEVDGRVLTGEKR